MYELIVKILGEKDYKKYTIEEIEEMKRILLDVRTEEVRLRKIERESIENSNTLRIRKSKEKTSRRSI